MRCAQAGDLVLLVSRRDRKSFIRTLEPGQVLQTHHGTLAHDDLIGQAFGSLVMTHLAAPFYLLTPTTDELVRDLPRESQIIFPKDAGYILMKLGIRTGSRVIEAGTGSGGLCLTLATFVGDSGHVYSYDVRDKMQRIAQRNLQRAGLVHRVTLKNQDARQGFDETDVDAVFLDMREPWEALDQARQALRGGGLLGSLVPTANQLIALLEALHRHPGFGLIEVEELILRSYKIAPARVRPDEHMIGHTGYLIFARAVSASPSTDTLPEQDQGAEAQER